MSRNMGMADRSARAIAGFVLAFVSLSGVVTGPIAITMGLVAVVLLVTALVGVCPLYTPFGVSTHHRDPDRPGVGAAGQEKR